MVSSGAAAASRAAHTGARGSSEISRAARPAKATARPPQAMKSSRTPTSPGTARRDRPMSQATMGGWS
jgi:hypothetical protein